MIIKKLCYINNNKDYMNKLKSFGCFENESINNEKKDAFLNIIINKNVNKKMIKIEII